MQQVLIFILFVVCLSACQQQRPKSIESNTEALYEQISELMNQQAYDSVLVLYDQLLLLDSNQWAPHFHKANLFIQQKELEKALEESELVIRKNPALAEGWYTAGVIHDWLGDEALAREFYQRGIALYDEKIEKTDNQEEAAGARFNRAILLILNGQEMEGQQAMVQLKNDFPYLFETSEAMPQTRNELLMQLFNAVPEKKE